RDVLCGALLHQMPLAARLSLFARCLFLEPRLTTASAKFGLDLVKRNAARVQQHKEVIKHVGGLADQALPVFGDGGNCRLDGLFAELFCAMINAAMEQLAGIGTLGAFAGARLYAPFQIADGKTRHRQVLPSGFHITSPGRSGEADYGSSRTGRPAWAI